MSDINLELLWVRLVSFAYSFAGLAITAIGGVVLSPDFAALVQQNFGNGALTALALLVVTELAKHARNLAVLGAAERRFGSAGARQNVTLI
jgi:hypothetical protein